jgi:hypothetical protein
MANDGPSTLFAYQNIGCERSVRKDGPQRFGGIRERADYADFDGNRTGLPYHNLADD